MKQAGWSLAKRERLVCHLVVAALPIVLLAVNDGWTFVSAAWIDPYVYTGYMQSLRKYLETFGPTYYESRFPWVLLGTAAHSLLPFERANLALRLLLLYGGTASMYALVITVWRDRRCAALAACLLGVNTSFLWSISHDYPDGAAIVALLATMACAASAARSPRWPLPAFGAGFAAMTAFSVQIYLALLLPLTIAPYFWLRRQKGWRALARAAACGVAGAALAFLAFELLHRAMGGAPFYLRPQLEFVLTYQGHRDWTPGFRWLDHASWLAVPALGLVAAVAQLAFPGERGGARPSRRRELARRFGSRAAWLVLVAWAIYLVRFLLGEADLQLAYYASFLIPFVFLSIAALLVRALVGAQEPVRFGTLLVAVLVLIAPFAADRLVTYRQPYYFSTGLIGFLVAAVLALVVLALWPSPRLLTPAIAILSVANVGLGENVLLDPGLRARARDDFLLAVAANKALEEFDADGELRFWYDKSAPDGQVAKCLAAMHLWHYRLISDTFPSLKDPLASSRETFIRPGQKIALVSSRSDAVAVASETAARGGVALDVLGSRRFVGKVRTLELVVLSARMRSIRLQATLPATRLKAEGDGQVTPLPSGEAAIRTTTRPWDYAATLAIDATNEDEADRSGFVRVRVRVEQGEVGIGVLTRDWGSFIDRASVRAGLGDREIVLVVPRLGDAGRLLVQTWGQPEEARVIFGATSVLVNETPPDPQ